MPSTTASEPTREFYDAVILSAIIGKTRGSFIPEAPSTSPKIAARRKFLQSLAYLCDYREGGPSTTAIAMEQADDGIVYWFATNVTPPYPDAKAFLEGILRRLENVHPENVSRLEHELFEMAIDFSYMKHEALIKEIQRALGRLLHNLRRLNSHEEAETCQRVQQFLTTLKWPTDIAGLNRDWKVAEQHLLDSSERDCTTFARHLNTIQHIITLFSRTRECVKVLVATSLSYQNLLQFYSVERVQSSIPTPKASQSRDLEIRIPRMVRDYNRHGNSRPRPVPAIQNNPVLQEAPSNFGNLHMWDYATKVHAELLILDHFYIGGRTFYEGDHYIACSKPACYLCYYYILAHPDKELVRLACSTNMFPRWGLPIVPNLNDPSKQGLLGGLHICQKEFLHDTTLMMQEQCLDELSGSREVEAIRKDTMTA